MSRFRLICTVLCCALVVIIAKRVAASHPWSSCTPVSQTECSSQQYDGMGIGSEFVCPSGQSPAGGCNGDTACKICYNGPEINTKLCALVTYDTQCQNVSPVTLKCGQVYVSICKIPIAGGWCVCSPDPNDVVPDVNPSGERSDCNLKQCS